MLLDQSAESPICRFEDQCTPADPLKGMTRGYARCQHSKQLPFLGPNKMLAAYFKLHFDMSSWLLFLIGPTAG